MKFTFVNIDSLANEYSASFKNEHAHLIFIRGLYLYFIIKILLSWDTSRLLEQIIHLPSLESPLLQLIFLPGTLFNYSPFFFLAMGILLAASNFWRPNYILSILIFWYSLNYYRLHYALANGSDVVMVTLLFLSIGLSIYPIWNRWTGMQMLVSNGAGFIIKIQIALIYLLSGVDKLYSPAWRSGEAIHYMLSLDYMVNPHLTDIIPDAAALNFFIAWAVILFELCFPILIWKSNYRNWLLVIGALFHLAIIIVLSLIDFGLIMIISYLIFLTDKDFIRIGFGKRFETTAPAA